MSKNLYKSLARAAEQKIADDGRWEFGEPGIVVDNDDPEKRHRIKVTRPLIDEDNVYDDWISPATPFSIGDGFGSVSIPPVGSEVRLFGDKGQKYNFVYHGAVYNEDAKIPDELGPDTPGMKVPKNLSWIAGLLMLLQAQNLRVIIEQLAHFAAQNIESFASALHKITGQNIESLAEQRNKMTGETIEQTASGQITIRGGTVTINSDGSVTIHGDGNITISSGGAVQITGASIKLFNRTVLPTGPSI